MRSVIPIVEIGEATHVGRVRTSNEDNYLVTEADHPGQGAEGTEVLIAVADGMGGANAGEVASAVAVQSLKEAFADPVIGRSGEPAMVRLEESVKAANRAVWDAASLDSAREGMGTTLVTALLAPNGDVTIANVGDSRAYFISGDTARQLTSDNSWVVEQVRAGRMTPAQAQTSPYRNVLSRSLGVEPKVEVDMYQAHLASGEFLMLCSDGVSTYVGLDDLREVFRDVYTAQEAADELVKLALDRGGSDNATVVVARMTSGDGRGS
jgi:protein phosphatase